MRHENVGRRTESNGFKQPVFQRTNTNRHGKRGSTLPDLMNTGAHVNA